MMYPVILFCSGLQNYFAVSILADFVTAQLLLYRERTSRSNLGRVLCLAMTSEPLRFYLNAPNAVTRSPS